MDEKESITYNACQTDARTPEARAALESIVQAAAAAICRCQKATFRGADGRCLRCHLPKRRR